MVNGQFIYTALCDLNGIWRGKRLPVSELNSVLKNGIRMPLSITSVDIWGHDTENNPFVFESGDKDGICKITETGLIETPWEGSSVGMLPLSMYNEDGSPFTADPRHILKKTLDRYHALDWRPVVATELEFYLFDQNEPQDNVEQNQNSDIYAIEAQAQFDPVFDQIYAAAEQNHISLGGAILEAGCGQFEINLNHIDDALKIADNTVILKYIIKSIARKHGYLASFMAKPKMQQPGNGMHVHFSILDTENSNIFNDDTDLGSEKLHYAIGGLVGDMADSMLIFAPNLNSYKRFQDQNHAPTLANWGYENRTTAIRIPGGNTKARRIEHRIAGADANPYLFIATILNSALNGIETKTTAPKPITGNGYQSNSMPLPNSWEDAIKTFETSDKMRCQYGEVVHKLFTQQKKQEARQFESYISKLETDTYLRVV